MIFLLIIGIMFIIIKKLKEISPIYNKNKIQIAGMISIQEKYIMIDSVNHNLNELDINYGNRFSEDYIIDLIDKIQNYKNIRFINGDFRVNTQQYFENWFFNLQFIKANPLNIKNTGNNYINLGIEQIFEAGRTNNRTFKLYYE
jgi:hypothetical protein